MACGLDKDSKCWLLTGGTQGWRTFVRIPIYERPLQDEPTDRFGSILLKNSGSELVEVLQGDRRFGIVQARGDSHLWRHPASGDLASATDLFVALHRPNTRSTPKSSPPKIRVFQQNRQNLPLARTPESSPKRSCGERVPMSCPTDPGQVPANGPPRAQSPEIGIREC